MISPLTLAARICAGDLAAIPDPEGFYHPEEWKLAAFYALDGDESDFRLMRDKARAYPDYLEWVASARSEREQERRVEMGFDAWFRGDRGEPSWRELYGRVA